MDGDNTFSGTSDDVFEPRVRQSIPLIGSRKAYSDTLAYSPRSGVECS